MSRKSLCNVLGCFGMAVWLSSAWLSLNYVSTRPKQPMPEQGRIWEINNHGDFAYITTPENALLWSLRIVGMGSVVAAIWLANKPRPNLT